MNFLKNLISTLIKIPAPLERYGFPLVFRNTIGISILIHIPGLLLAALLMPASAGGVLNFYPYFFFGLVFMFLMTFIGVTVFAFKYNQRKK